MTTSPTRIGLAYLCVVRSEPLAGEDEMTTSPTRIGLAYLCVVSLIVAGFARPAQPEDEIVGSISGKVFATAAHRYPTWSCKPTRCNRNLTSASSSSSPTRPPASTPSLWSMKVSTTRCHSA